MSGHSPPDPDAWGFRSLDALIEAVLAFRPDFRTEIAGITVAEIDALEAVVRQPLPSIYRQYLEHMGSSGSDLGNEMGSRASDVCGYYEDVHCRGGKVAHGYIVIGPGDRHNSIALKVEPGSGVSVVTFNDRRGGPIVPYASSLTGLLFRRLFQSHQRASKPVFGYTSSEQSFLWQFLSGERRLRQARMIAGSIGLTPSGCADAICACFEAADVAMTVDRYKPNALTVHIWADSRERVAKAGAALSGPLHLPPLRLITSAA